MRSAAFRRNTAPSRPSRVSLSSRAGRDRRRSSARTARASPRCSAASPTACLQTGSIGLDGARSSASCRPMRSSRAGLVLVPEGRQLFAELTVRGEPAHGCVLARPRPMAAPRARTIRLFPALKSSAPARLAADAVGRRAADGRASAARSWRTEASCCSTSRRSASRRCWSRNLQSDPRDQRRGRHGASGRAERAPGAAHLESAYVLEKGA